MVCNHKISSAQRITENKPTQNHFVRSDTALIDLKMLRSSDVCACNADELVDLRDVKINRKMPSNSRMDDFIAQAGNPYLFKVDDVIVKVEFGGGKDFSEILTDVILAG